VVSACTPLPTIATVALPSNREATLTLIVSPAA
jgi:hypothetical protein